MPDSFSKPQTQQRIAPPVPIEQANAEKQDKYAALSQMKGESAGPKKEISPENRTENIPFPDHPSRISVRAPETPEAADRPAVPPTDAPTESDRRDFMRKALAGQRYTRVYKLFGGEMSATLEDRSTEETEMMYDTLEADGPNEGDTDVLLERYQLALQVRSVDVKGREAVLKLPRLEDATEPAQRAEMKERVKRVMKLPKPVYQALMEVVRRFEEHVAYLTDRALDQDFWKAGGEG